jgi:hypothetical protein
MHKKVIALQILFVVIYSQFCGCATGQPNKTVLNVALFGYIPDDSTVESTLKKKFESANPNCQINFISLDPYHDQDSGGMATLQHFKEYDVVETDLCRMDDLAGIGLDSFPTTWTWYPKPDDCVGGARAVVSSAQRMTTLPHWICENFAMSWSATESSQDKGTILGDFRGSTTLGEFYANALVDYYGADAAEKQLQELAKSKSPTLDSNAVSEVKMLAARLPEHFRHHLPYYHDHFEWYAWTFGARHDAVLVGYSESLFYTELEMNASDRGSEPIHLSPKDLRIQPLRMGQGKGTPSWVDGFVIPKGKLEPKKELIEKFLIFMKSPQAYRCFEIPESHFAIANLLPAYASIYDDPNTANEEPLLSTFRDQFDSSFRSILTFGRA